jgi:hypothetical protein
MGEGLSKREDDFQDEVAKLAGNILNEFGVARQLLEC